MQPQPIILIPPTHEQSTPSFHVEGSLAAGFLRFLQERDISAWQPPERLEKRGPDGQKLIEIEIEAGTSLERLEAILAEFQKSHPERGVFQAKH